MSEKLKLVWENSPETPIDASSLSKYVEYYSEGLMLFVDSPNFISNGDSFLKLRANSKIPVKIPVTNAFFGFNDSVVSHDSRYTPASWQNITFRIETKNNSSGKSIAIEDSTTNLILNSSFESALAPNWIVNATGSSSVSVDSVVFLDGQKSVKLVLDSLGSNVAISQTVDNINTTTSLYSASFYYMANFAPGAQSGFLNVQIIGTSSWFLYPTSQGWTWQLVPYTFQIPIDSSMLGKWIRYEISNIDITAIESSGTPSLKIIISSTSPQHTYNIDSVQLEQKPFCSSFTVTTRAASQLRFSPDILRLDEGTIDFNFMLKDAQISGNINFITLRTITSQNALWFYYDFGNENFTLSILDSSNNQHVLIGTFSLKDYLNEWIRILVVWKKQTGMKLFIDGHLVASVSDIFTPISELNIRSVDGFEIGENDGIGLLNGLLDDFKINLFAKSDIEIGDDFINGIISPDKNIYTLFENVNQNIVLDGSYLDVGTSLAPNSFYYIWAMNDLNDDGSLAKTARIIISPNNLEPAVPTGSPTLLRHFGRIFAGFTTDSNRIPIYSSLWDLSTQFTKTAMFERMLIHGTQTTGYSGTPLTNIEFRSTPYGAQNDATFNVDTRFTKHVYGNVGGIDFFNLDTVDGILSIDDIQIDGHQITTTANELLLTAVSGQNVEITGATVNIHKNGGLIWLDSVIINGTNIYPASNLGLTINNDKSHSSSNIIIDSMLGNVLINGANTTINPTTNTHIQGVQTQITSSNGVVIHPTGGSITITNSSTGNLTIDNLSIKNNTLSTTTGNLILTATTGSVVEVSTNASFDNIASLSFGSQYRQMINAFSSGTFGIGVQNYAQYFRSTNHFAFYKGGGHADTVWTGGTLLAAITDGTDGLGNSVSPPTVSPTSKFIAGKVYNAVWNDLAECWEKDQEYEIEYGTVMVQTNHGIRPSVRRAEKGTVGVVSNTYGFILGTEGYDDRDLNSSKKAPIAISGRVSVRLFGDVKIGDLLVSYKSGYAARATWFEKIFKYDRIIGQVDSPVKNRICLMKVK
jgi:hypothetical protein